MKLTSLPLVGDAGDQVKLATGWPARATPAMAKRPRRSDARRMLRRIERERWSCMEIVSCSVMSEADYSGAAKPDGIS